MCKLLVGILLLTLFSPAYSQVKQPQPVLNFGWSPPKHKRAVNKVWQSQLQDLVQYNDENDALLYRFLYKALEKNNLLNAWEKEANRLSSLNQGSVGSCVGMGTSRALEVTAACDIHVRQELESFKARMNPHAIYAITRLDNLGRWDGSTGAWAVSGLKKYGSLHDLLYGEYDLTDTPATQGRKWASSGLPQELLTEAKKHLTLACSPIKTTDEAKAALQNGYGIILCSGISYSSTRDQQGFSPRTREGWNHCMACIAYRGPSSGREGFLIINSWNGPSGSWINGPLWPPDQPAGSFWVTPADLQIQLHADDSYAIAGYKGFKKRLLKWEELFKVGEEIED